MSGALRLFDIDPVDLAHQVLIQAPVRAGYRCGDRSVLVGGSHGAHTCRSQGAAAGEAVRGRLVPRSAGGVTLCTEFAVPR